MMPAMRVFNVRCYRGQADALTALVKAERRREVDWWTRQRAAQDDQDDELGTAERTAAALALRAEFDRLRAAGALRGTYAAFLLPALRAVMAERGWAGRRWKPVPPRLPGRPWGTHDQGFDARVTFYLDDELGETLSRACYWTSAPTVARLQEWYDEFGDHWRGRLHNQRARFQPRRPTPSDADLDRREQLIEKIVTTGTVLREAIDRAIGDQNAAG